MNFNISRFKNNEKVTYECEVVTPMFLSGADQKEAELRTQSIKGALRFWWRALYGRNYSLEEMKQKEDEIFGSTEVKSSVEINLNSSNITVSKEKLAKSGFDTLNYLAYGYDDNKGNIRPHIISGSNFSISLSLQLKEVFDVFVNSGGLGSRSRNGYGSLYSKNSNQIEVEKLFKGDMKPFTSFSKESDIFRFEAHNTWESSLKDLGNRYKNARYEMKKANKDRGLIGKPFKKDNSRYAKPYFFHISKIGEKFQGQILFLPSIYQNNNISQDEYMTACNFMNSELKGGAI